MPERKRVWVDARQLDYLKEIIQANCPDRFGDNVLADLATDKGAIAAAIRAAITSFRRDEHVHMREALYRDMAQNIRNMGQLLVNILAGQGLVPNGIEIFLKDGIVYAKVPGQTPNSSNMNFPVMTLPSLKIETGEILHKVEEIPGQVAPLSPQIERTGRAHISKHIRPHAEEYELQQILLQVAKIISDARIHPAPFIGIWTIEFDSAVQKKIIDLTDNQISFGTSKLLITWLARYWAQNISEVWQDFAEVTYELRKAESLRIKLELPKSFSAHLLSSLEREFNRDILERLEEMASLSLGTQNSNPEFLAIYTAFCNALPELDYKPDDLDIALGTVLQAAQENKLDHYLHEAIELLAARSQKKSEMLTNAFLEYPTRHSAELAQSTLKVLWAFDALKAHSQAMKLTEASLLSLRPIGVKALALFSYETHAHERELSATVIRLEELCENSHKDFLPVIAQAFGILIQTLPDGNHRERTIEGFLRLSSHGDPDIQFAVASCLIHLADESADADWFWEAMDYLSSVPASRKRILDYLDNTIYGLVEDHPERITRHIQNVITSRSHGIDGENDRLLDLYENTVIRLIEKQQPALESTITRWLASKDIRLHQAAADIVGRSIRYMRHQPDNTIRLDKAELNTLEEQDVHRVICALTGHLEDFKALADLLISVLSRNPLEERTSNLITEALEQVVLYNEPSIDGYLKNLTANTNTTETVRKVIDKSLASSDTYYTSRKSRPHLKELLPPNSRIHRYEAAQQRLLRNAWDREFNQSRLQNLIPITHTKFGQSSFSAEHGNMRDPTPMKSFTTLIDWPRECIIDPLGRKIKQINWKYMALHGLPDESTMDSANNSDESNKQKLK